MTHMPSAAAAKADSRNKDAPRILGIISIIHWISHFHLFALPMLFPYLRDTLGASFVELGFAMTVFAVVSGLTQAPIGFLVDRVGARTILLAGMTLGGIALILLGLHLTYTTLLIAAGLLGLANSVYHPGDYAILSEHMDKDRMGRAYSIHTFAGFAGGAMAPPIIAATVSFAGGQAAMIFAGALGPIATVIALAMRLPDAGAQRSADGKPVPQASIITPALIVLTIFFTLLSLSTSGLSSFSIVALMKAYDTSYASANTALTAFLGLSALGVLFGGVLADRTQRHGQIAAACFTATSLLIALVALFNMSAALLIAVMGTAGFLSGVIAPSRDMLVSKAAPPGASGRAFGIVSTGFNIGGGVSPLIFGWVMDHNMPQWVFGLSAAFMALTVLIALATERAPRNQPATSAPVT